jgi:murein DD-endopeptidase MepM/ murein hydrolase activator NlpD
VAETAAAGVRAPKPFKVVSESRLPNHWTLEGASAGPAKAYFDGIHAERLRFRFSSAESADVRIRVVRRGEGSTVRRWVERDLLPFSRHSVRWDGAKGGGDPAPDGKYRFRIGELHGHSHDAGHFRLRGFEFPVRGSHSYGGSLQRFGAERIGGRTHQGQDVFAGCRTNEVAARGGRVQARGSDPKLYGNWLVIDGRGTSTDYRYAHLLHPTPLHDGERVRTGQSVGKVGRTGNARNVGCMMHLEIWPSGWGHGHPIDPLPSLRRWDGWS